MCTKGIRGRVSIDTLNRHLDQYSIIILIDTRSTLYWHLINSRSIVGRVLIDSFESIENQSTLNWLLNEMSMEYQQRCWWSVNRGVDGVSMEYWSRVDQARVSIEGIDRHSTADAFSAHDLALLHKFIVTKSLMKFCLHVSLHTGSKDTIKLGGLNHSVTSIIYVTTAFLCIFLGLVTHFKYNRLVAWYW